MKPIDFVKWLYPEAKKLPDISPVFTVAQAALESGWGGHIIGKYNLFGITKGAWTGKTLLVDTTEVFNSATVQFKAPEQVLKVTKLPSGKYHYDCKRLFRYYDSLESALQDHFKIFYQPAFREDLAFASDPVKFAQAIQQGKQHYATDPNYVKTMTSVIGMVQKIVTENKL